MKSIFRLEEIRRYNPEGHLYSYAGVCVLGHYSSLDKALAVIPKNNAETYDFQDIVAYMVKEIKVDGDLGEVLWLSVRSYNANGDLIDECPQDYNLINQFEGRDSAAIRFRVGDIVEVLDNYRFYVAIVAALPPTPSDQSPVLDAEDDCYLVLPSVDVYVDHLHVAPTHVFRLGMEIDEEAIDHLHERLKLFQEEGADKSVSS